MKRNAGSFIKCIESDNSKFYIPKKIRNELALQRNDMVEISIKQIKTIFDENM